MRTPYFWLVLFLAATFRFVGVDWDQGTHSHPDENYLSQVVAAVRPPSSPANYFDTSSSPLNPRNVGFSTYVYGTLPLFLARALNEITGTTDYRWNYIIGRVVSACADLGTITFTYLIGLALYGPEVALLAALLLSCCVLSIQQAHFFVVDPLLVFFSTAALYFSVLIARDGKGLDYLRCGAMLGCAAACKISALLVLPLPFIAGVLFLATDGKFQKMTLMHLRVTPVKIVGTHAIRTWAALGTAALSFRALQPYAFTSDSLFQLEPRFLASLAQLRQLSSAPSLYPPALQWIGRTWLFPVENMVLWGLGPLLGFAVIAGFAAALVDTIRSGRSEHLLLLMIGGGIVAFHSVGYVKVMRYLLPAYPALILLASDFLRPRQQTTPGVPAGRAIRAGVVTGIVIGGTAAWAAAFTGIYYGSFVRVRASEWIRANVPSRSTVAVEAWDDPLPVRATLKSGYRLNQVTLPIFEADSPEKREHLLDALDSAQYLFINSQRGYGAVPRNPVAFPMTALYYERLFREELGFALVASMSHYPSLAGIEIATDTADESFSVYDQPRVMIFAKVARLPRERLRELLAADTNGARRLNGEQMLALAKSRADEKRLK